MQHAACLFHGQHLHAALKPYEVDFQCLSKAMSDALIGVGGAVVSH